MRYVLLLALLCAGATAQEIDPLRDIRFEQKLGAQLPLDAKFTDSAGREVMLGDAFGERPVILALVYYECPQLCTLVLNGLTSCLRVLQETAGKDFDILAISIDPGETPDLAAEKKRNYVGSYRRDGAANGWRFWVGEEEEIKRVADTVGYQYVYQEDRDEYAHAAGVVVATPDGVLSRYFFGVEFSPRDVKFGLMEASGGKIGSIVDAVLLFCFYYDPTTGKYGLWITRVLRVFAVLTVLVLAFYILRNLRRERRLRVAGGNAG